MNQYRPPFASITPRDVVEDGGRYYYLNKITGSYLFFTRVFTGRSIEHAVKAHNAKFFTDSYKAYGLGRRYRNFVHRGERRRVGRDIKRAIRDSLETEFVNYTAKLPRY